jgi:hypothetical protein
MYLLCRKTQSVVAVMLFILISLASEAQVSLLPQHTITIDGITVIRDSHNAGKWYYIAEKPTLQEKNPSNKENPAPAFQMITYQSGSNEESYDGGVIQFSVSLYLPENIRKKIEKELKNHPESEGKKIVTLAPLPFDRAEAILFDESGRKMTEAAQAPGLSPAYITGALPFQMKLNRFENDLYSALIDKKNSGIGVLMNLGFEGLLPPAGFKATIDWDQTFTHISKSSDLKVSLGNYFLGFDVAVNKTKIREELTESKCLEVESLTNEVVTAEIIDKYMEPVLEKMRRTLVAKVCPPEKIDVSMQSSQNVLSKCFFAARVAASVELRDIRQEKKGRETFVFDQSVVSRRTTACGSFIGINKYSDTVKKELTKVVQTGSWASAFLLLPAVDNSPALRLESVSMTASIVDSQGKPVSGLTDTALWSSENPHTGKNRDGNDIGSLKFPLLSLFDRHNNKTEEIRKEYSIQVETLINQSLGFGQLNSITATSRIPVFDGDLPLPEAIDLVDSLIIDMSALTFGADGIRKVKLQIKEGNSGKKIDYSFPQKNSEEKSVVFLFAADDKNRQAQALIATITFDTAKKRNIPWLNNGKNLRELVPSMNLMLFDEDWQ